MRRILITLAAGTLAISCPAYASPGDSYGADVPSPRLKTAPAGAPKNDDFHRHTDEHGRMKSTPCQPGYKDAALRVYLRSYRNNVIFSEISAVCIRQGLRDCSAGQMFEERVVTPGGHGRRYDFYLVCRSEPRV
ncbi:MAG: hypothetical protein AB199_01865 [Parcubacteria bacterium C7867-004]|nr:MAG: hypothetical protein AB199_01865 [Parcubacteria bacterium C7867-004]